MGEDLIKLSFLGDIMCELPLLKASKVGKDEYNFDKVFYNTKNLMNESDYVVGNLETICAGKEYAYTEHVFSFNTPTSFIEAIKKSGIDMVTTATNHSLDRGIAGLLKNLDVLEKYNLKNIGTFRNSEERDKVFVEDFNGLKVAFLNYTYGTNTHINGVGLKEDEKHHINLMKPQNKELEKYNRSKKSMKLKPLIARNLFKMISLKNWILLKRKLGLNYYTAYQDNELDDIDKSYLEQIKLDIQKAKDKADIVVMCMHSGGQFHSEPGKYSEYMMEFMDENGVDLVVGNHPHVVQRMERFENGMLGAYSLGNFSISPSSVYIIPDNLPEYSVILHVYLNEKTKEIEKTTFSILKIIEDDQGGLSVYAVEDLMKRFTKTRKIELIQDVTTIFNKFTGLNREEVSIKKEYELSKEFKIGKG